jgi:hypothetical protein
MNNSKERREYEQKFYPLFKFFHAKNSGFKEKEAIFYNENKIAIFRGASIHIKYYLRGRFSEVYIGSQGENKSVKSKVRQIKRTSIRNRKGCLIIC